MSEILNLDINENRYSRFELIPWWNQELLHNSTIMVVGAGAIGNEWAGGRTENIPDR